MGLTDVPQEARVLVERLRLPVLSAKVWIGGTWGKAHALLLKGGAWVRCVAPADLEGGLRWGQLPPTNFWISFREPHLV